MATMAGHEVAVREKAIVVCVETDHDVEEYALEELRSLVSTAGADVVAEYHQHRSQPDPATYLGKGKAEEIKLGVADTAADLVLVDAELTPVQQRNLQETVETRVIDRTQLILDIFGQRARTREGKLQVELAQLSYLLPRLMNLYTQFERQQGGIGVRGGAGETKLETDRRKVRERIRELSDSLAEVCAQRKQQRSLRSRLPFPSATLVGYTSAGKSTLMNTLAGADVFADPKLFATLDPTTRRVALADGWAILLTDSVGFIRNLPHDLVAAFRATLEEVNEADFLVHVVDASHPQMELQRDAVMVVLDELGAADKPTITVFNKADRVPDQAWLRGVVAETENSCYMCARTGDGVSALMDRMIATLRQLLVAVELQLPYDRADLLSQCYECGRVSSADYEGDFIHVRAEVTRDLAGRVGRYRVV